MSETPSNIGDEQQYATKMRYARLMLQLYHTDGRQNVSTVDRFITAYSQDLDIPGSYRSKVEEQLLIGEHNHLKQTLQELTQEYSRNAAKLRDLNNKRYKPIKELIANKQSVSLQNLEIRLKALSKPVQDSDQELNRVKKLIQNGLWGCLTKLNERLNKLSILQLDTTNEQPSK